MSSTENRTRLGLPRATTGYTERVRQACDELPKDDRADLKLWFMDTQDQPPVGCREHIALQRLHSLAGKHCVEYYDACHFVIKDELA